MLKDKFMKMLAKKGKKVDPDEKDAKSHVMKELQSQAGDAMRGGFKKVSVASDSEEGLEKGLDKAKELITGGEHGSEMVEPGEQKHDGLEGEKEHDEESDVEKALDMIDSPEECEKMIEKLMEKKKQLGYHS